MENPNKYIRSMELGYQPGDDGATLYNAIIKAQFDLEEKRISLEKEMAMHGFHQVPDTEITPAKHQRIYFDPKTKKLKFEWAGNVYRSAHLQIKGEETYCFIMNNKNIIPIKDEETMKSFLDLILT